MRTGRTARLLLLASLTTLLALAPAAAAATLYPVHPIVPPVVSPTYNVCPAVGPTVTGVSPSSGPSAGGTTVTISGTCLGGATEVDFVPDGVATGVTVNAAGTQITAVSPVGIGTVDVMVTTPSGMSSFSSADQFTYQNQGIAIYDVAPGFGPPGTGITITAGATGSGFVAAGVSQVNFVPDPNSPASGCPKMSVAKADFTSLSDQQITLRAPYEPGAGLADCLYDIVTQPTSTPASFNLGDSFLYVFTGAVPMVTSVSPAGGPAAGGTTVQIGGFGFTGATAVNFGPNPAQAFTVASDSQITATAPAGSGTVPVTVTTPVTTNPANPNGGDTFTYAVSAIQPTVTGVSPSSGDMGGGTPVTITGTGFTPGMVVVFGQGGAARTATGVTVVSGTEITALSPAHDPGVAEVIVGNVNTGSAPNPAAQFVFEGLGAAGTTTVTPPTPIQESLYVANTLDGTVSVLDAATNAVVSTINLNVGPTFASLKAEPFGIVADPRRQRVYVTVAVQSATSATLDSPQAPYGLVAVIDTNPASSNYDTVTAMIPLGTGGTGSAPGQPALSPDGRYLYVPRTTGGYTADAYGPTNGVVVLDTSAVTASLDPSANAGAVVDTIQSLEPWSGRKDVIGPNAGSIDPVSLSGLPVAAVASPDGKRVYVLDGGEVCFRSSCGAGQGRPAVAVIDTAPGSPTYNTVTAEVALRRGHAAGLALSPGGRRLYALVNPVTAQVDAPVEVIDTTQIQPGQNNLSSPAVYASLMIAAQGSAPCSGATDSHGKPLVTGGVVVPSDLGLSPDGSYLFVSDYMGPLWVVDTAAIQPGTDGAPTWWAAQTQQQGGGCNESGTGYSASSPVLADLLVGGMPNAIAVDPLGTVYVASGGRSTGLYLDGYYSAPATPGNRVTAILPYSLSPGPNALPGDTSPGNTVGAACGAPCVSTVPVGQYPKAMVLVPAPAPPVLVTPTVTPTGVTGFSDLGAYGWARGAIDNLAAAGVLRGVAPGRFGPAGAVTRAQFATLLQRLFHLPAPSRTLAFNDVPRSHWAYAAVEAAAGFMPRQGTGAFAPDGAVTRQDVAAAIVRILAAEQRLTVLDAGQAQAVLAKVDDGGGIAAGLRRLVATAIRYHIMKGFPDGSFQPHGQLTRAQAAVLLYGVEQGLPLTEAPAVATPAVTGLSPATGPAAGGTEVTITGSAFTGATAVLFQGTGGAGGAAASSFTVASDGRITATAPPGPAGAAVDVEVVTPAGTSAAGPADRFTYQTGGSQGSSGGIVTQPLVTGISPSGGPAAGGTTVTITGLGFTGATAVAFGGVPAASFSAVSDGEVTAVSPAGSGTADVTVTTPGGTSPAGSADEFTYR